MLSLYLQLAMSQVVPLAPPTDPLWDVVGAPSGAVVVSSWRQALWSADGERFVEILAGDDDVSAVALDDDGTAWVARGGRIGVRSPDGAERWITAPGTAASTQDLWVRGRFVVWVGDADPREGGRFMVSQDGGRTFAARPEWDTGNFALDLALDRQGRVHFVTGWEASCGGGNQDRYAGRVADLTLKKVDWAHDAPGNYVTTSPGWTYVGDESCEGSGLCALTFAGEALVVATDLPAGDDYMNLIGAADDTQAWLVLDERILVHARGTRTRVVNRSAPSEVRAVAVAAGRPWVVTPLALYRLDGADWREVRVR